MRKTLLLWAALSLLLASPAAAQGREDKEREARTACLGGDYGRGAMLLSELFVTTRDATYIYNQGRCFEQNARYQEAISRFQEYLRVARDAGQAERAEAEKHIADCRAQLAPPSPAPVVAAEQAMTMYNLRAGMPAAIYVSPQGLSNGWANTGGEDIELTKTILATVQASYCVNNARVFSVGFSYGAMMCFAIGCELGGTFRAIAPMSGALYSGCKAGTKPIAMWGTHGLSDAVVPIDNGRDARDEILSRNQCGTTTVNTSPSSCVSYEGCAIGYPVTWCEFAGDHSMPSWASGAIVAFFAQFP